MKLFANITKRDDEQRMVWGVASTESLDSQGEVVKLDAVKGAWEDYMKFANIREMHQPSAVGKCKEYEFSDKDVTIGVKVVDDVAWKKVTEGVYTGFSIGGKAVSKMDGVITQLRLTEISLVDRPANPDALISVWKGESIEAQDDGQQSQQPDGETVDKGESTVAATEPVAVEKGMWNVERLMAAFETVRIACMDAEFEAKNGGHTDEVIAEMKAVKDSIGAVLLRYLGEEVDNAKADAGGDVAKAGARFSKATKEALAAIHADIQKCNDTLTKMGYAEAEEDDTGKADGAEDLLKTATEKDAVLADIAKVIGLEGGELHADAIAKVVSERDVAKAELAKAEARIKELEAEPAPTGAPLNGSAVSKNADGATNDEPNPALAELQKKADEGTLQASDLMKHIHSNGGRRLV